MNSLHDRSFNGLQMVQTPQARSAHQTRYFSFRIELQIYLYVK